jgi:hypothetical protein
MTNGIAILMTEISPSRPAEAGRYGSDLHQGLVDRRDALTHAGHPEELERLLD